jgi:nucleotide-binding universal stress UspA family protein
MKSILADLPGYGDDRVALEAAIAVAKTFSAHVDCLHVHAEFPSAGELAHANIFTRKATLNEELKAIEASALARRQAALGAFEAGWDQHELPVLEEPRAAAEASMAFREVLGSEVPTVCEEGRYHDLIVLAREPKHPLADVARIGSIAVGSGRPVLLASTSRSGHIGRRIAIAWRDKPEAARALTAAAPFLERADSVLVLTACEDAVEDTHVRGSGERLVLAMKWNGYKATACHLALGEESPSLALLNEAYRNDVDMLVMGAYGHTRFREIAFGGFTRDIIGDCSVPVLMMH